MSKNISKNESELLVTAIERIVSNEVLENDISGKLPTISAMRDSNTVYRGKVSVLFVDMRHSTQLPELFSADQLVKIYRSYIRTIVQAVRYSGGDVRDFMGDGVLAVFVDNDHGIAEDNAVYAARYIVTAIDKILNPVLFRELNHRISYGVGIHTGEISLSKVGMKGKEQDDESENEFGIAWIGNSTNLACKQSGAVDKGTIFISATTYAALSDINEKKSWRRTEIKKGDNILTGFVSQHNYLPIDGEIAPCCNDFLEDDEIAPLVEKSKSETIDILSIIQDKIDELSEQFKMLGIKEQELKEKQRRLTGQELVLKGKQELLETKEEQLDNSRYEFYCDVLYSGFCKKEYVIAMGQTFWESNLKNAISAGVETGRTERVVKQEISCYMVSIYEDLELYDKAYDFLVEQVIGGSWLNKATVQKIVSKIGYCDRLKSALYERLAKKDLSPHYQSQFEDVKNWLVFEHRQA